MVVGLHCLASAEMDPLDESMEIQMRTIYGVDCVASAWLLQLERVHPSSGGQSSVEVRETKWLGEGRFVERPWRMIELQLRRLDFLCVLYKIEGKSLQLSMVAAPSSCV